MASRKTYAKKGIEQIPRVLSLMDRNPYSVTYGCMDRTFWLDKSIDFPSSIAQFGIHALALVYSKKFPNNPYYKNKLILEWCKAGITYWQSIQKNDGSFDEFYPNERGWAGPTGFLLYAILSSYELLKNELSEKFEKKFMKNAKKAAIFLAKYDELGVLSNHHAMALLPIYYYYRVSGDNSILYNFEKKWQEFLNYQSKEGWFLEYDGADLGYLSATVSFLGKLYPLVKDNIKLKKEILTAVEKAIDFSSNFAYPNGYYAGTIGSRQTLHFYPHGYEFFGDTFPLGQAVAEKMLQGLEEGKLVPPAIMPDRYLVYRVPEMLLSYLDYKKRNKTPKLLTWEKSDSTTFFPDAGIFIAKRKKFYCIVNFAKGGVIKIFNLQKKKLIYNNCGFIGVTKANKRISSEWIGKNFKITQDKNKISVKGNLYSIGSTLPTPFTQILLRLALLTLGQSTLFAYKLKGVIRNMIILKNKETANSFNTSVKIENSKITITNKIDLANNENITNMQLGGEFSVRYVPQSMYFQLQELDVLPKIFSSAEIKELNSKKTGCYVTELKF